jgi:hypothetical protein
VSIVEEAAFLELLVDELSVDELSVDELSVDELSVDEIRRGLGWVKRKGSRKIRVMCPTDQKTFFAAFFFIFI